MRILAAFVLVLVLAACQKEKSRVAVTLQTECEDCRVEMTSNGEPVHLDNIWGKSTITVPTEDGHTVSVTAFSTKISEQPLRLRVLMNAELIHDIQHVPDSLIDTIRVSFTAYHQ